MKCSGKNCPMQYPYDEKACAILETCPYATLIPYTNADRIRAKSDEELAEQLVVAVNGLQPCTLYYSIPTERTFLTEAEAVRVTLEYLQQPAEEET